MEFYLGILIALVGALVLVWAFVRPRKGNEPHCRRCRFSLAGLTEPKVCPECGRDLAHKRATIRGHRPSPMRAVFWCVGLALLAGALVGIDAMNRTGFLKLTQRKPTELLQLEATLLDDLRASMATEELIDRIVKGKVSARAQDRLVRTALARHAQTWRAFPDAQWAVICDALSRGALSFEQIQRVWDNCFTDPRLSPADLADRTYYPGESVTLTATIDARAGRLGTTGLPSSGLLLEQSMGIYLDHKPDDEAWVDGQQNLVAKVTARGSTLQRFRNPTTNQPFFYRQQFPIKLPERTGVHTGSVELEVILLGDRIARNAPGIDTETAAKLNTLRRTYTLPFTCRVVGLDELEVPAVDPATLADDPSSLIEFEVTEIKSSTEHSVAGVITGRIRTTQALDPAIGLGGQLVFQQAGQTLGLALNNNTPHEWSPILVTLYGYNPGPVRVSYKHDQDNAVKVRHKYPRVLSGTIDLGTITVPEPEPEPEPEAASEPASEPETE